MKTLYTAFKGINNTSCQLVKALKSEYLLLTNSFPGLEHDISGINETYDAVIMFGVDKSLTNSIRIEGCAKYNGEIIHSSFNMGSITHNCDEIMIPYRVSLSPTKYLCNAAYWHMLRKFSNTVFIHIPSLGGMEPDFMKSLIDLFE